MDSFRPRLAQIRVIQQDDATLVVDYHPVVYLVSGVVMAILCFWVGFKYLGDPENPGWIAIVFGIVFFAGFALLFYRRMTLTFDRQSRQITHFKRTMLFRRNTLVYPLDAFAGVAVESRTQSDGKLVFQRGLMRFSDREPVPITTALITGQSPSEVADAINAWAGTNGHYRA